MPEGACAGVSGRATRCQPNQPPEVDEDQDHADPTSPDWASQLLLTPGVLSTNIDNMSTQTQTMHPALSALVEQLNQATPSASADAALIDPAQVLTLLHQIAGEVDDITAGWVAVARIQGVTWAGIGDSLHMSRQAAQQRYGRRSR